MCVGEGGREGGRGESGGRTFARALAGPPPHSTHPPRAYRGLYIVNWVYRWLTEPRYKQWLVWICGVIQTGLYADFFYYYALCWKGNKKLQLPA